MKIQNSNMKLNYNGIKYLLHKVRSNYIIFLEMMQHTFKKNRVNEGNIQI